MAPTATTTTTTNAVVPMNFQSNLIPHKRKTAAPLGYRNLGNSCYLNSVLQCLTYTPPFANFCLQSQHSSICDSIGPDKERKRECPFCLLEKRITRSLSSESAVDGPIKIHSCLRLFADHFRSGRQEDAHEFLRYVIDACHNTCLRIKKLRGKGSEAIIGSDTVVKDIFGGALQSQVKCSSCGSDSNKVDEIMDISLDVLHSSSLNEAMAKFFQPEILDGNNKYKCENCKKLVVARKQMSISQAPNVLVIQLKRFEGIFGGKIDKAIAFEEGLVLSKFMCKTSQDLHPEYQLFASIVHSGYSPESGHYYAYVKDALGSWYCCNDSFVTLSSLPDVLSEKAYILFFSRSKQKPSYVRPFASNGVKPANGNCADANNSPKKATPAQKVVLGKAFEQVSAINMSTIHKNERVSSGLQLKFNLGNSGSKRVSATESVNLGLKNKSGEEKGNGKDKENKENNVVSVNGNGVKGVIPLVNGNGIYKHIKALPIGSESRQTLTSPTTNGGPENNDFNLKKSNTSTNGGPENNDFNLKKSNTSTNGCIASTYTTREEPDSRKMNHEGVSRNSNDLSSKRNSLEFDSCILFASDAQSQVELKVFKEALVRDASSLLRSCGWSDEVYDFMQSRKRLRAHESGSSISNGNELKKKLIAEAKPSFIPKLPESVKANLIKRLKLFSEKKPVSRT